MSDTRTKVPAPVVAAAGWAVPGLGYWLIGQRARAATVFVVIVAMFVAGVLIAGIRVIDVPGYGDDGNPVQVVSAVDGGGNVIEYRSNQANWRYVPRGATPQWVLKSHPLGELLNKPWYIGQILAGPMTLVASKYSIDLSKPVGENPDVVGAPKSHVRVAEIGTLYTAVAGMLNLLVIIDAAHRANRKEGAA